MSKKDSVQIAGEKWGLAPWFQKSYRALVFSVLFLIALGGSVRLMKAGLACPDWPLCFGDFIPDYHPQVYFEFVHRVLAGLIAVVTTVFNTLILRSRAPKFIKGLSVLAIVLLVIQVVFGGLTVLLLLQSYVVTTHLMLGISFFATLLWIYLTMRSSGGVRFSEIGPRWLKLQSTIVTAAIFTQILLGGLVASHFASLVCTDFPTCHGQLFPTFSGIIGLHVIHRLGAYILFCVLLINWLLIRKYAVSARLKMYGKVIFSLVCGQVCLGIANVLFLTPPIIAVAHLALGVIILSFALMQLQYVRTAN